MSCHGCRVLRKRCSENCALRPCLEWIESPEAKARATLFVSKFFGRSDLINFISSVPSHKRNALFQSLLFEAVGRTVNPVNGAIGLLSSGNWHICQAAVRTVLDGGTPPVLVNNTHIPEHKAYTAGAWSEMMIRNQIPSGKCGKANAPPLTNLMVGSSATADEQKFSAMTASNISKVSMSFRCNDVEEPKLLNLLV
ncbi:unnamed protein product [Lactuca virosa]|uniref:LOB domain-containing protein n=1 Tax=Lactuca virosa TaxID=75947 RepID=A0AAU9M8C4_9ASTR|nr:unnamed protein product [Lactuca virosa]